MFEYKKLKKFGSNEYDVTLENINFQSRKRKNNIKNKRRNGNDKVIANKYLAIDIITFEIFQ